MSVWSRSHNDLAKLAKTLQDNNRRTRRRLTQRSIETPRPAAVHRTRSLSPSALSSGEETDSAFAERTGRPDCVVSTGVRSLSCNGLSLNGSGHLVNGTSESEPGNSVSSLSTTPRLIVTSADGEESFHADALQDSFSSECSDVFVTSSTAPVSNPDRNREDLASRSQPKTPDSPNSSNSHTCPDAEKHRVTFNGVSSAKSPQTSLSRQVIDKAASLGSKSKVSAIDTRQAAPREEEDMVENGTTCTVPARGSSAAKRARDAKMRVQSPDSMKSPTVDTAVAPSSPRLSARSPDLLKKLKEVTFAISASKTNHVVNGQEKGRRRPGLPENEGSPRSAEKERSAFSPKKEVRPVSSAVERSPPSPESGKRPLSSENDRSPSPVRERRPLSPKIKIRPISQEDEGSPLSPEKDRNSLPPEVDKRPLLPEIETRPLSQENEGSPLAPEKDTNSLSSNMDKGPLLPGMDRRPLSPDGELRELSPDVMKRPDVDNGTLSPDVDTRPVSPDVEERPVSPDVEKRSVLSEVEKRSVLSEVEKRSLSVGVEKSPIPSTKTSASGQEEDMVSVSPEKMSDNAESARICSDASPDVADLDHSVNCSRTDLSREQEGAISAELPQDRMLARNEHLLVTGVGEENKDCQRTVSAERSGHAGSVPPSTQISVTVQNHLGSPVLFPDSAPAVVLADERQDTASSAFGATVSAVSPAVQPQLRIHEVDLRLVPLSAIGIVVGANRTQCGLNAERSLPTTAQKLDQVAPVKRTLPVVGAQQNQEGAVSTAVSSVGASVLTGSVPSAGPELQPNGEEAQPAAGSLHHFDRTTTLDSSGTKTADQPEDAAKPFPGSDTATSHHGDRTNDGDTTASRQLGDTAMPYLNSHNDKTTPHCHNNDTPASDQLGGTAMPHPSSDITTAPHRDKTVPHNDGDTTTPHQPGHSAESVPSSQITVPHHEEKTAPRSHNDAKTLHHLGDSAMSRRNSDITTPDPDSGITPHNSDTPPDHIGVGPCPPLTPALGQSDDTKSRHQSDTTTPHPHSDVSLSLHVTTPLDHSDSTTSQHQSNPSAPGAEGSQTEQCMNAAEAQTVRTPDDQKSPQSNVTSFSSENKSVGSSSSGIETDCVDSPGPGPGLQAEPKESEGGGNEGRESCGGKSFAFLSEQPSDVFPDASNGGGRTPIPLCAHSTQCCQHSVAMFRDQSCSVSDSADAGAEGNSGAEPLSRNIPTVGSPDARSPTRSLPPGNDLLCQSVGVEADRSSTFLSESETDRSVISASVQVSLSGTSETRSRSSRSHRRRSRTKDERSGKKNVVDLHGLSQNCLSSSSVDSLLSVSDTGTASDYSSDVLNYLTSSSHRQGPGQPQVNRRRLEKLLRILRHPDDSASLGASGLSDFTKTVADLQHLCVSLSRNLEQQQHQQLLEQQQQRLREQQRLLREQTLLEQQQLQEQQAQRAREKQQREEEQQRLKEEQLQEQYRLQEQLKIQHQQEQVQQQQFQQQQLQQRKQEQLELQQQQEQQEQLRRQQEQQEQLQRQQEQQEQLQRQQEQQEQLQRQQELLEQKQLEEQQAQELKCREQLQRPKPAEQSPPLLPFRLRLQTPSPQKRAVELRKLRTSSDFELKSPKLDSLSPRKACLFQHLPVSAADLNQALIEEALKNTELLDRLGVDKDVFGAGDLTSDDPAQPHNASAQDHLESGGEDLKEEEGKEEEKEEEKDDEECETDRGKMETPEEEVMRLDNEFDKTLVDMKPHVLKLPLKSDRQKCAVWIKKLCEPPSSGITGRKNRNVYAQLMLHMLKRGTIQMPFDRKPEEGPLQPLPSYMAIYFDEPLDRPDGDAEKLPDWVEGELGESVGSSLFRRSDGLGNPAATSTWVSNAGSSLRGVRQRPHTSIGIPLDKDPGLSPIRGDHRQHTRYSADDLSMEVRHSPLALTLPQTVSAVSYQQSEMDWSRPLGVTASSVTSLGKGATFQDDLSLAKPGEKEIALRSKMIEAKFHEEKLRLQQKHDAAVQKILDRKNSEIEDVKSHYRSKTKELEETITKLERKVQTLVKEAAMVRETKDKQIMELKKMVEDSNETQRNEYEKRIHDMEADLEQQKFELQKLHTRNIQEILDDTNARLQRMDAEYNQQVSSTTNIIKELESRVQQLTGEVDRMLSQRTMLEKEKAELLDRVEKLTADLEEQQHRNNQLERSYQKKLEASEHEMRTLRNKTEASLEFLKQEHNIAAAKAADTISDLEQQVDYLKKALKDAEEQRQRQMRETEQVHQQDKLHLENLHDKQVRSMKKELEQLEQEMQRKLSRMEQLLKDKDGELQKQKEQAREQAALAEKALEEFKQQVEKNQNQIYADMKHQMEQVEADLKKSKHAREKQSREFARQLEEEKYKHEHELTELRMSLENEKAQMLHEVHVQKEHMASEHERELEQLRETHKNEMKALEFRYKERQEKDAKMVSELEGQVAELREELVQANQLRKQQLVELGLLREEEKQKMQRDHEAEIARHRADAEQQRLELQKMHSAETERLLEKTNDKLKSIEREYMEKGKRSSETISELQNSIKLLRDDIKRAKENAERRVSEIRSQSEEEKQNLKKQYSSNLSMVQHELESQRTRCHNLERQIQKLESDFEEKMTRLKMEHEERLKGMLPGEMKRELEDTISSLKSQVNTLQQRAAMLQEELDLRLKNPLGQFGSRTSSPIKSSV